MVVSDFLFNGIVAAVLVLIVVKVIIVVSNTRRCKRKFKDFPQNPSNPILGNLIEYPGPNEAGFAYHRENIAKFPRFHVFWLGTVPLVFVTHPDLVKIILQSSEPKSHDFYHFLHPWLGQGLLTSYGNRWSRSRRLLTPAFHFDILKGYVQLKNELCNDLLEKFEVSSKSGESLDVFDCVSMFTLDVILQSTMSYVTECQKAGKNHPYVKSVYRLGTSIISRMLKPWFHSDWFFFMTPAGWRFLLDCRFVHRIAGDIIKKRRKELESKIPGEDTTPETMRKRRDFLDTLITARDEEGNGLTDKEIRDEVDTFLFEGHDTTASAISWCLYSLAGHPDVQQRVQEEVDNVFNGRDSDWLLWDDMNKLPYLTMALKEAMRLHNPVPSIMRELTKDTDLDGHIIPKGSNISISIHNVHHNPAVWEDSMKYDPDRFLSTNSEKRDPFAFVPFSAGPRNCVGQNFAMDEMKIALARILHRYQISLDPTHKVIKREALVVKADTDIKLCVKSRLSS